MSIMGWSKSFMFIKSYYICFSETPFAASKEKVDIRTIHEVQLTILTSSFFTFPASYGLELILHDNSKIEFAVSKESERNEWLGIIRAFIVRFSHGALLIDAVRMNDADKVQHFLDNAKQYFLDLDFTLVRNFSPILHNLH